MKPFTRVNKEFLDREGYCVIRLPSSTELSSAQVHRLKEAMRDRPVESIEGSVAELAAGSPIDQKHHLMTAEPGNLSKIEETTRAAVKEVRDVIVEQLREEYGNQYVRSDGVLILAEKGTARQV